MSNIVFITGSLPPMREGIGDCSEATIRLLVKQPDLQLKLVTSKGHGIEERIRSSGLGAIVFDLVKKWDVVTVIKLSKKIGELGSGKVFIEYPTKGYGNSISVSFLPLFIRLFTRKAKTVIRLHEFGHVRFLRKLLIVPILFFADYLIMPAGEIRDQVIKRFPFVRKKSRVIRVGSNIPVYAFSESEKTAARKEFVRDEKTKLIMYFGDIYHFKGFDILTEAMRGLLEQRNDIAWLVVGDFHSLHEKEIWQKNVARKYPGKIFFLGYLPQQDVSKYLSISDICVLPFKDGASLRRGTFIAALTHGLPVVTIKNESLMDIFKDGENIFFCDKFDPIHLKDRISAILDSATIIEKVRANVKRLDFSWDGVWTDLRNVFQEQTHD